MKLGYINLEPDYRPATTTDVGYRFLLCARGRCRLILKGKVFILEPGYAAFALPGEGLSLGCGVGETAKIAEVSLPADWFGRDYLSRVAEELSAAPVGERGAHRVGADLYPAIRSKLNHLGVARNRSEAELGAAYLEGIVLDLCLGFIGRGNSRREAPVWLKKACGAMEQSRNLRSGGRRLSEISGKSPEHVIRQMRRYYGMTPTQYVNELRLRAAGELLAASEDPILDISFSLGFENPSYFSQLFKKRYGLAPTAFRARNRV